MTIALPIRQKKHQTFRQAKNTYISCLITMTSEKEFPELDTKLPGLIP